MGPDPCCSQMLVATAGQLHRNASFISVKSQDAVCSPFSHPWRLAVGGVWKADCLGLGLAQYRGQGRRKYTRIWTLACTDSPAEFSRILQHTPSLHTPPKHMLWSMSAGSPAQAHVHTRAHTHFHASRGTLIFTHFQTHT